MAIELPQKIEVGFGFAIQSDPFQSGREAAQMAKSRYSERSPDLVLALGPANIHFQEFIEGVRLVTGENALVGIPSARIVTHDLINPQAVAVILIYAGREQCTIACSQIVNGNGLAALTSLNTQFRTLRGNTKNQFDHRGFLIFDNAPDGSMSNFFDLIVSELGLEPWLLRFNLGDMENRTLMCFDQILKPGLIGIEYLSDHPWGIGEVNLNAFKNEADVLNRAVHAAIRDANHQLNQRPPKIGFLIFNLCNINVTDHGLDLIFKSVKDVLSDMPLIGLFSRHPNVRHHNKTYPPSTDSVLAVLIPS